MGITKTILFTEEQNVLASYARVLANPARVAILHYLAKSNSCINSDLVNELGLAQATISQHLKELKTIGLIKGTIEGTSMCYCIDGDKWQELKAAFAELFDREINTLNNCSTDDNCC